MLTVEVFLADPIITDIKLPALDITKMRFVYCFEMADGEDEQLLEETFRALNINHPVDYHERSLSVGDVVTIAGARSYRCDWLSLLTKDHKPCASKWNATNSNCRLRVLKPANLRKRWTQPTPANPSRLGLMHATCSIL